MLSFQILKCLLIYSWPIFFNGPITLTILLEVKENQGTIYLAVYDAKASFLKLEEAVVKESVTINEHFSGQIVLENMPQGTYAIAAYCDKNNNEKLDKNLFGAPIEPYGFSQPIKSKWRKPTFEEAMISIEELEAKINIKLAYWTDW